MLLVVGSDGLVGKTKVVAVVVAQHKCGHACGGGGETI